MRCSRRAGDNMDTSSVEMWETLLLLYEERKDGMTGRPFNITVLSCVKEGRMDGEDVGEELMIPLMSDRTLTRRPETEASLGGLPKEATDSMAENILMSDMTFSMMSIEGKKD